MTDTAVGIGVRVWRAAIAMFIILICSVASTVVAVFFGGIAMVMLPSPDITVQQLAEMVMQARVAHVVGYVVFGVAFVCWTRIVLDELRIAKREDAEET